MIHQLPIRVLLVLCFIGSFFCLAETAQAEVLDKIIAIVEDDVVLEGELEKEVAIVMKRIENESGSLPPPFVIRKQVLEKIIIDKLQRHLAESTGVNVSDEMLDNSAAEIARRNGMDTQQFRQELESQGMSYESFRNNLRNEIIVNELRGREIGGRIKVTDQEIQHYLETQDQGGTDAAEQYHLGHILVAVREAASSSEIQKANAKAEAMVEKLRDGQDFTQIAISESDDGNALKGGDLGWRTLSDLPTLFVDSVKTMAVGDIAGPIRSPSGFHVIKLLEKKGAFDRQMITKTKVRHILIKTNELIDDNEARNRLLALKLRIHDGDDFAALARAHSDDKGSAVKGGDLGWVGPGDLVKPFENAMEKLKLNEISEPIQTQFGWHLIQVLGRENKDNSDDFRKNQARDAIRKRKIEEETELWLRRLRDEAYVEIYQDRL